MFHFLKLDSSFYDASENGDKVFEIRYDDRGYSVGDILILCEWDGFSYTGRMHLKRVSYVLSGFSGLVSGYVALSVVFLGSTND